jgi:AcrR family transcriptional regulator
MFTVKRGQRTRAWTASGRQQATTRAPAPCGFSPPDGEENRRVLTRDRLVAEALAIMSAHGAAALSMRALATRLGVVPAVLYRHVHSNDQLYDLILDGVLAEVDCQADPALPWTGQVTALAHRLRTVLEDHPGIAALLKTRDPISLTPLPWPRRSSSRPFGVPATPRSPRTHKMCPHFAARA